MNLLECYCHLHVKLRHSLNYTSINGFLHLRVFLQTALFTLMRANRFYRPDVTTETCHTCNGRSHHELQKRNRAALFTARISKRTRTSVFVCPTQTRSAQSTSALVSPEPEEMDFKIILSLSFIVICSAINKGGKRYYFTSTTITTIKIHLGHC